LYLFTGNCTEVSRRSQTIDSIHCDIRKFGSCCRHWNSCRIISDWQLK